MNAETLAPIQNGLLLERQGKLQEAEEWFTLGIHKLRLVMQDNSLGNSQILVLTEYMQDAARRVQRIRELLKQRESQQEQKYYQQQQQQQQTVPKQSKESQPIKNDMNDDYLSFLDDELDKLNPSVVSPSVQSNNIRVVKTPQPSPIVTSPIISKQTPTQVTIPVNSLPSSSSPSPPPPPPPHSSSSSQQRQGGSLSAHFAPRAPDILLKAIDVATKLSMQKEFKRAIDVLQHAYTLGNKGRNNPGNFKRVEEHLMLLRREYYNRFKPRFLQDNPFLPEEMELIRKSGITSTILLPIWDDVKEGYGSENVFMPCEGHWEDKFTPRLSKTQRAAGAQYLRISEIKPKSELCIIHTADPLNVKQTVVGDCSMVCSLIICASYQQRFPKGKIINNVIFPQDNNGDPVINPKGKYCVKMLVNGMTRLITVDDRFPANPRTHEMLCTYSRDETELWVSIMEKAFVKVCGGSYDFPGSSSASDLYKLSGWLPDGVSLDSKDFDSEIQWKRLYKRHVDGSVLITASTPSLSDETEKKLKLASDHAYAVLAMKEINEIRLIQLKNPWGRRTWSGMYSLDDERVESKELLEQLQYSKELADQGIFWITWNDLCKNFSRCSLSWNPYMLFKTPEGMSRRPTRLSCHNRFPYTISTGQMPQFHIGVVNAPNPSRMHLVFSRHITELETFGLQFEKDNPKIPYIGLKVYNVTQYPSIAQQMGAKCTFDTCYCRRLAHGSELDTKFEPLNDVVYKNMAAHTMSFNCPPGTSDLLVVVARLESIAKEEFNFSLTLHTEWNQIKLNDSVKSSNGVYMHAIPHTNLKYSSVIAGQWVKGVSCGGRSDAQTFVYNPQYQLSLSKATPLSVRLCVSDCEQSARVHIVRKEPNPNRELVPWSARVGAAHGESSLLLQSPLYAHGGVVVETSIRRCIAFDTKKLLGEPKREIQSTEPPPALPAGDYTIIPALWTKGIPAKFELVVETTVPHELREIPQEGTGFKETIIRGELRGGTPVVSSSIIPKTDPYFSSNSKVCITAITSGVLTARLILLLDEDSEASVSSNLSLFRSINAAAMECVASTGAYDPHGIALHPVKIEGNITYVLVVSSSKPSQVKYVLRLYSSCDIKAQIQ